MLVAPVWERLLTKLAIAPSFIFLSIDLKVNKIYGYQAEIKVLDIIGLTEQLRMTTYMATLIVYSSKIFIVRIIVKIELYL